MFKLSFAAAALAALMLSPTPTKAETITLGADEWCPYNCTPGTTHPGYMIEIAERSLAPHGIKVRYKTQTWSRAIFSARNGLIDGLVAATPDEVPEFTFHRTPVGELIDSFLVLEQDPWQFSDLNSLKGRKIGAVKDYDYGRALTATLTSRVPAQVRYASGQAPFESNVRLLLTGRLDTVIEDANVALNILSRLGADKKVKLAGRVKNSVKVYIAFSPRTTRARDYANWIDDGVARMRETGELTELLAKYNLKDWAPAKSFWN